MLMELHLIVGHLLHPLGFGVANLLVFFDDVVFGLVALLLDLVLAIGHELCVVSFLFLKSKSK